MWCNFVFSCLCWFVFRLFSVCLSVCLFYGFVCLWRLCVSVFPFVFPLVYVTMHECMYVCMYICIHVCKYCMCVFASIGILFFVHLSIKIHDSYDYIHLDSLKEKRCIFTLYLLLKHITKHTIIIIIIISTWVIHQPWYHTTYLLFRLIKQIFFSWFVMFLQNSRVCVCVCVYGSTWGCVYWSTWVRASP